MSHRLTVAKIRKMSDAELSDAWSNSRYPFDRANNCGYCLLQHAALAGLITCDRPSHGLLSRELSSQIGSTTTSYIRKHLVKLFALRRKYARFYPKVKP